MLQGRNGIPSNFDAKVQNWVINQLADPSINFQELVAGLPGVYPAVALEAVRHLFASGQIGQALADRLITEASRRSHRTLPARSLLPLPHPLDFEWRFTPDSSRHLLDLAERLIGPGKRTLLFGTPGVALEALSGCSDRPIIFLGEDNTVTRRIESFSNAVGGNFQTVYCGKSLPQGIADAVIVDPPWYLDFIRPMLTAAATACRVSGFLIASLPPMGASQSAEESRAKIENFTKKLGLEVIGSYSCVVAYETPFFEANSLRSAGLFPTENWRRGDLVVFRKVSEHSRKTLTASVRKTRWVETNVGRMRIYVRTDQPCTGVRGIRSIIKGDVLPSVSRRDRRRAKASVWTSGNRVFHTDNSDILLEAVNHLANYKPYSGNNVNSDLSISEHKAVERVADFLAAISKQEAAEERAMRHNAISDGRKMWKLISENCKNAPNVAAFG